MQYYLIPFASHPSRHVAFLNAVLRGPQYSQNPALRSFLKLNERPTSSASINLSGSLSLDGDLNLVDVRDMTLSPRGGLVVGMGTGGTFGSAASTMSSKGQQQSLGGGAGAADIGDLIFQSHHQHHQQQQHGSMAAAAAGQNADGSKNTLVGMEAKGLAGNQQFKWRKLYTNLRVKLKPHEIGVRFCPSFNALIYLFLSCLIANE